MTGIQRSRTGEDEDLFLARSTKKIKASVVNLASNEDETMAEKETPLPSFKEKLMGSQIGMGLGDEDEFGPLDKNDGLISISTLDSWPCLVTS